MYLDPFCDINCGICVIYQMSIFEKYSSYITLFAPLSFQRSFIYLKFFVYRLQIIYLNHNQKVIIIKEDEMSINKRYNGWINCTQKKSECRKKVIKVFLEWAYVFTFVLYEIRSLRSVIFYISCMLSAFLGVSKPYLHVKVNCGMFNLYF